MKLTKREVQQRVLKGGKPLDLELFEWDIESRTFKSDVNGLVLDFTHIDNIKFITTSVCSFTTGKKCTFETSNDCIFDTRSNCTFKTGINCVFYTGDNCTFDTRDCCTFKTGNYCTFDTGYTCTFKTGGYCVFKASDNCTFKTGGYCTFYTGRACVFDTRSNCTFDTRDDCVFNTGYRCTFKTRSDCTFITHHSCNFVIGDNCTIITKPYNEVIIPKSSIKLTTCPQHTPGYLVGNDYYINDVKQDGEYMITDGMLSKIISKKGNVYKVRNYIVTVVRNCIGTVDGFDNKITYMVQDGDIFAHGETIKEARESLIYKISNRDTSAYNNLTIGSMLTKEEAIKMYRVITGSCEYGVRRYVESLPNVKSSYTIQEIIELTTGQYGNDMLRRFFKV